MTHSDDGRPDLLVRRITAVETHPLRMAVLRPGRPESECVFPGDDDPGTFHVGTVLDDRVVSIASLYVESRPADAPGSAAIGPEHATTRVWRLRGMATEPDLRGTGAGRAALDACELHARSLDASLLWCNARIEAVGFYERLGWCVLGEEFDIPTVGPHFVMEKSLR